MNISILGSTGSIGTQTLELCRIDKNIKVSALSANSNVKLCMNRLRNLSL